MSIRLLGAAALLYAWIPACAQTAADAARGVLSVSVGAVREDRRDASDSPVAYGGAGPGATIEYERTRATERRFISLSAGFATLTPLGSIEEPEIRPMRETFESFALRAGVEWSAGRAPGPGGMFSFGIAAEAGATIVRHLYAGLGTSQQSFDLGVGTLAPTVQWSRRAGAGIFTARLGVPLLAWVDHPYGDVRYARQASRIRFAPLTQLRAADGALAYEFAAAGGTSLGATYRLGAFVLDDDEPVRRVSQSFSIGVVRRFGVPR